MPLLISLQQRSSVTPFEKFYKFELKYWQESCRPFHYTNQHWVCCIGDRGRCRPFHYTNMKHTPILRYRFLFGFVCSMMRKKKERNLLVRTQEGTGKNRRARKVTDRAQVHPQKMPNHTPNCFQVDRTDSRTRMPNHTPSACNSRHRLTGHAINRSVTPGWRPASAATACE